MVLADISGALEQFWLDASPAAANGLAWF